MRRNIKLHGVRLGETSLKRRSVIKRSPSGSTLYILS
nr:MAG TPA: hypothetical protein [Caudoviricetes sp.]